MSENRPNRLQRCPVLDEDELEPNRSVTIIPEKHAEYLTEKEQIDYYEYRKSFLTWLLRSGKNPNKAKGYSPYTVYNTGYRAAAFDYWVWEEHGQYLIPPSQTDASAYMDEVALRDVTDSMKGKAPG